MTAFMAGVAQLVELQPSKLDVAGSNPAARSTCSGRRRRRIGSRESRSREVGSARAHVAQSVERVLGKDEVTSPILVVGSTECGR